MVTRRTGTWHDDLAHGMMTWHMMHDDLAMMRYFGVFESLCFLESLEFISQLIDQSMNQSILSS
jgi:hypothetical protein